MKESAFITAYTKMKTQFGFILREKFIVKMLKVIISS